MLWAAGEEGGREEGEKQQQRRHRKTRSIERETRHQTSISISGVWVALVHSPPGATSLRNTSPRLQRQPLRAGRRADNSSGVPILACGTFNLSLRPRLDVTLSHLARPEERRRAGVFFFWFYLFFCFLSMAPRQGQARFSGVVY